MNLGDKIFYPLLGIAVCLTLILFLGIFIPKEWHPDSRAVVAENPESAASSQEFQETNKPLSSGVIEKPETPLSSGYKNARTTVFWVGESASEDNDFIANDASAWDGKWRDNFGGFDDPDCRLDFLPCGFIPKENPFYVALPYNDFDERGIKKESAKKIPRYTESRYSILKNRWVEIRHGEAICYGQWEDVGPNEEDDFGYVFGENQNPKNAFGEKAGLDVSPALADCLGLTGSNITYWRFVAGSEVPPGPWKETVTTSFGSWQTP